MLQKISRLFSSLSLLFITGCTSVGIGLANMSAPLYDVDIVTDIAYGTHNDQKMDLYIPAATDSAAPTETPRPVIIFFYGGRWSEGSKDSYGFVARKLAAHGYIVAVPDYRKYPEVKFPAFVDDGAAAVTWVHENIGRYHGSGDHIYLAGHSAGAHTGALLSADHGYFKGKENAYRAIKGFAGLAGPYAFTPEAADLKDIFGPPEKYPQMRVPTFIDGSEPPMLLLYGSADTTVGAFNAERLVAALKEYNVPVASISYKNIGHVGMLASSFIWYWPRSTTIEEDMISFFQNPRLFIEHTSQSK